MVELSDLASFVKVCGVTSTLDAQLVIDAHATALGLIFAQSRRQLSLDSAREIAQYAKGAILVVGVFRNDEPDVILHAVEQVSLDAVQVHGVLDDQVLNELRRRGLLVIKALSVGESEFFTFDEGAVDAVLVDGPTPGSGAAHSWDDLANRSFSVPVIVAGGLDVTNVARVIETTGAWGVDVATGVESSPGVKDRELVMNFVGAAERHYAQGKERGV